MPVRTRIRNRRVKRRSPLSCRKSVKRRSSNRKMHRGGSNDISNKSMFEIANLLKIDDKLLCKSRPPWENGGYLIQEFKMDQKAMSFINKFKNEGGKMTNIMAFTDYLVNKRNMSDYIKYVEIISSG